MTVSFCEPPREQCGLLDTSRHQQALITITSSVRRLPRRSQDTWASGCGVKGVRSLFQAFCHLISGISMSWLKVPWGCWTRCLVRLAPRAPTTSPALLLKCKWAPIAPSALLLLSFFLFFFTSSWHFCHSHKYVFYSVHTHSSIRRHRSQKATSFFSVDAKTHWVARKSIQKATYVTFMIVAHCFRWSGDHVFLPIFVCACVFVCTISKVSTEWSTITG